MDVLNDTHKGTDDICFIGEKTAFGTRYHSFFDPDVKRFGMQGAILDHDERVEFQDDFYIFEIKDHTVVQIVSKDLFIGAGEEPVQFLDSVHDSSYGEGFYYQFFLLPPMDEIPADYTFISNKYSVVLIEELEDTDFFE